MNKFKIVLFILLGIISSASNYSNSYSDIAALEYNILFVGNSLTYTNNLPNLVTKAARKKELKVKTNMIALPNYALMDHWIRGDVQKEIATNAYDIVIVQQGPSSQQYGREILFEYGKMYNDVCKKYGAQLGYFMVWPSRTYYSTFDDVIKTYSDAAEKHDVLLFPVGEKWKEHFDATKSFDYYGSDGFHPSLKGSNAAADIIVETLLELG